MRHILRLYILPYFLFFLGLFVAFFPGVKQAKAKQAQKVTKGKKLFPLRSLPKLKELSPLRPLPKLPPVDPANAMPGGNADFSGLGKVLYLVGIIIGVGVIFTPGILNIVAFNYPQGISPERKFKYGLIGVIAGAASGTAFGVSLYNWHKSIGDIFFGVIGFALSASVLVLGILNTAANSHALTSGTSSRSLSIPLISIHR